jgi:tetratricopeptide (TPR) repeat protein
MGVERGRGALAAVVGLALLSALAPPVSARAWDLFGHKSRPPTSQKSADSVGAALTDEIGQALDERRYVDAGDLLDQAAALKISSPELTLLRGELFLARERYEDALASFRAAAGDPAVVARALQGEGLALSQLGKSDEALTALEAATHQDKTLWRAWNALGRAYDLQQDWAKALAAYAAALAVPGVNVAVVLNNRGYSHLLQRQFDLASADFVAALEKDPALAAARMNLRLTLGLEGAYDRATATGVGDDRAAVLNNVGLAAAMRGDYPQAEKLLSEAMAEKGQFYARAAANLQMSRDLASRADKTSPDVDTSH